MMVLIVKQLYINITVQHLRSKLQPFGILNSYDATKFKLNNIDEIEFGYSSDGVFINVWVGSKTNRYKIVFYTIATNEKLGAAKYSSGSSAGTVIWSIK